MQHGGNLHDAKALYPEAPEPWLDLSTGINPNSYPPMGLQDPDVFTRLPTPQDVRRTEEAAAHAYGAGDAARVVAASGTQALIRLLPRLRPGGKVAVVGPTYGEHERGWLHEGHNVVPVADLSEAVAAAPDVVVIVNPNNPDGRIAPPAALAEAAAWLHRRDGWLVVDEAFADLEEGTSVVSLDLPATIVLRSFGKAYGLAGVRLGFAVSSPTTCARVREALGPWAVSGPALAIGAAALADTTWLDVQRVALSRAARDLDAALAQAGLTTVGGTRLFRLARHPDAPGVFERLAHAGIWVRKFSHDPTILRFGIPLPSGLARLEQALETRLSQPC